MIRPIAANDLAGLERLLSEPTPAVVDSLRRTSGDIIVLGAGGKMGPSLARLAVRASSEAGIVRRVIGVSRWSNAALRAQLEADGVETLSCDLFDHAALAALPETSNVIYMAGRKFGTSDDQSATWATNAYLPGLIADRFCQARIVAFSTGNVYPLTAVSENGPSEADAVAPVGEYAQAALARERIFEFQSRRHRTPMAILRLNYAVEPRYGVLRDIADKVKAGTPVDLTTGWVNVIWQRDANAIALQALEVCSTPPALINVTGVPAVRVQDIALALGKRLGVAPRFAGEAAPTALLSDARKSVGLFGVPPTGLEEMVTIVADWVRDGGASLNKPTHFEERSGAF